MDPKRILVVYYSRTNTTREVARAIRDELGCEIERFVERRSRGGALGYLRSVFDIAFHRRAVLQPIEKDPNDYDLVVVGTPIWNASVSTPVRTYLSMNRDRIRRVAFFCTYGGTGSSRALRQMEAICGQAPVMTLALRMDDVTRGAVAAKVRTFAHTLTSGESTGVESARAARPQAVLA
jgi:flavodoxin